MYRFLLERHEDVNGNTGTGIVAEGVVFSRGHVHITWLIAPYCENRCGSIRELADLHGHGGRTAVVWVDPPRDPGHPAWPYQYSS